MNFVDKRTFIGAFNFLILVFSPQGLNVNTPPWKEVTDRRGVANMKKCKSKKHQRRDRLRKCKRRPHGTKNRKHKEKRKQAINLAKRKERARGGRVLGSSTTSVPRNKLNRSNNIFKCPTEKKDSHSVFPGCAL